jgi:hypothetical protein
MVDRSVEVFAFDDCALRAGRDDAESTATGSTVEEALSFDAFALPDRLTPVRVALILVRAPA